MSWLFSGVRRRPCVMDRFYPGPEWSGNQEASQPIQNSSAHTPAEKKTSDNLSVKSKLRKLAEFRSRSKEFGSNDSLHLNPLNRSFSDPWLLKSDQREMDNELDLSKSASASSSNLTKEKVIFFLSGVWNHLFRYICTSQLLLECYDNPVRFCSVNQHIYML